MSKECTTHHHACDCREEKFKQLEQENAALRADKERLDFLDAIQWHGGAVTSPMMDGTRFRIQVGTRPIISGNTIRAAIDAARKEVQP